MNSLNVTYSTIHRCEIEIPEAFFRKHGGTDAYEHMSCHIAEQTMVVSGQNTYGKVSEWAEDSSIAVLREWEAAWRKYITEAS